MRTKPFVWRLGACVVIVAVLLLMAGCAAADTATTDTPAEPVAYLDFNEGSGITALDASGHGSSGTIAGANRTMSGGCGGALLFNGAGDYVSIPYSSANHPVNAITVSTWFYVDSFDRQTLVSTWEESGGYWLGFGDGEDLWWVVGTDRGIVAVPVLHEGIAPGQWHHVTGTYDGNTAKVYLDGALRNRINATGRIRYEYPNHVLLGADAGPSVLPDGGCPGYLRGGLDEVRIYDTALEYGQVMDDRFRCSAEPVTLQPAPLNLTPSIPGCTDSSGSLQLANGESVVRTLVFTDSAVNGTWRVSVPPGSKLVVMARDLYSSFYPDAWYVEVVDGTTRLDRSIAFPNTHNAPVEGIITSGNATVNLRYFDGNSRFPASVEVVFECFAPPPAPPRPIIPASILANPGIVIYTASWATLIAVLVVVIWLHRRKKERGGQEEPACPDATGNDTEKKDE
jgi:hypothetical protein